MKTLRNTAVAVIALLVLATSSFAQATRVDEIKNPPLRKFAMPQPKRIQLSNGMVIFIQEDRELPIIRGSATIRGGERDMPASKAGFIDIYSQAWRTGGTTAKTGDELDTFLEARAARVETGGDIDSTSVSMNVLKGDFDAVFPIFLDVLRKPAFRQEKIDLAKTQEATAISRRNDEPGDILEREAARIGYGNDSPYARLTEYGTVASITRDDLVAFHKQFVHPNNIILSFIGDFDGAKMEKTLRDTFSSWPRGPQAAKPSPMTLAAKPGVYFISKDDVTQSNIAVLHPGITRDNPDYPAIAVMNDIFSGGFSGRLMSRLRSERGLTYGVGGGLGADWDHPGLFRVSMATKSGTTFESVEALKQEVARLVTDPVTPQELSLSKDSILNAFVFTMDTRAKALNQQVLLEFYGFPADYFVKYPTLIQQVTAEDVQRVAKKYVQPDTLAVLVVGNQKEFEKPLSTLGTVTPIDITIPEPGSSDKKAAPSTGNAEGVALVNKVADFIGGKAKIDTIAAMQRTGAMSMHTPQGDMQADVVMLMQYPNSMRAVMNMPMGQITRVVTPQGAFMITPMGSQDIPGSQRDAALADMKSDLFVVLKNLGNPKYTFTASGTEKIGDVNAAIVDVNADGSSVRWYVDPSNGRLLRTLTHSTGPMAGEVVTEYTEWKNFGGFNLPVATSSTRNGEKLSEMKVSNVEINPTVAPDAFAKPPAK